MPIYSIKNPGTYNDDAPTAVTVKYQLIGGLYLKELLEALEQVKNSFQNRMRDIMIMLKDQVIYIHYQQEHIDEILHQLVELNYKLDFDLWTDNHRYEYLFIDVKVKRVMMVEQTWVPIIHELNLPLYTIDSYKDILLFHE